MTSNESSDLKSNAATIIRQTKVKGFNGLVMVLLKGIIVEAILEFINFFLVLKNILPSYCLGEMKPVRYVPVKILVREHICREKTWERRGRRAPCPTSLWT